MLANESYILESGLEELERGHLAANYEYNLKRAPPSLYESRLAKKKFYYNQEQTAKRKSNEVDNREDERPYRNYSPREYFPPQTYGNRGRGRQNKRRER